MGTKCQIFEITDLKASLLAAALSDVVSAETETNVEHVTTEGDKVNDFEF